MRINILILFLLIGYDLFSQEEDSLHVLVRHVVVDASVYDPQAKVESYIDVNDSIDMFLENMQNQFGNVEEENGIFFWKGIAVDGVDSNLKVIIYHGIWNNKKSPPVFTQVMSDKVKSLKDYEKRGLRIRVFTKKGKDVLLIKKQEMVMVELFEKLLNSPPEEVKEE